MSDVEGLVRAGVAKRMETLAAMDRDFREMQRQKLLAILRNNADTEFGRAHEFAAITSIEDFQRAVRPTTAADYKEHWERIVAGERNVLYAEPTYALGLTSGTTGEAKLIPMTKALVRGLKRAIGHTTSAYMARTGDYSLLRGYALQMSAACEVRRAAGGVPVGYVTGIMSATRAYPFHQIGIPPLGVLNLNWADKYRIIEERYADHDVRMLCGIPGYIVALLKRLVSSRGVRDMDAIWPNLAIAVTSGSSMSLYRETFQALCPRAELLEMYLCTEASVAFQPSPEPGLMPMVEDVFLEFVPEERWGEPDAPRLALGEVETNTSYNILITTPAGLYAYSPGDIVRFMSVDPPRLLVEGRHGSVLNLTTEKLDANIAQAALRDAGVRFTAFTVCPADFEKSLGHEWVIEFEGDPPADAAERIDRALQEAHVLYRLVREGDALFTLPRVTPVRTGTFVTALQNRPGQGKILRIYRDRRVRDELVEIGGR